MSFPQDSSSWPSRRFKFLALALGAVLFLTSCSRSGAESANAKQGPAGGGDATARGPQDGGAGRRGGGAGGGGRRGEGGPVPVTTTKAAERVMPTYVQAVGNVEAMSTVEIRSQVTGPLLNVNFTEGQDVEKGQLLFTIDPRPFQIA